MPPISKYYYKVYDEYGISAADGYYQLTIMERNKYNSYVYKCEKSKINFLPPLEWKEKRELFVMTQEEVSKVLNISIHQVRLLEKSALEKIKKHLESKHLSLGDII